MVNLDKYADHLTHIKDRLFVIDNFLSDTVCDKLLEFCTRQRVSFRDRTVDRPNICLNGETGRYTSCMITPDFFPEIWQECFGGLTVKDLPITSAIINEYKKGDYIPPHADKQLSVYTVSVPLQTEPGNRLVFGDPNAFYNDIPLSESDDSLMTVSYPDVKGRGYGFYGNKPIHWVPPLQQPRRSLICFSEFIS